MRGGDEGFTLVELLAALTLFMFVFAGIMTLMQSNVISSARASSRTKIMNVASSYIEQVRTTPYELIGTSGGDPAGSLEEQTFTQNGVTFHVVPTVTWVGDDFINGPGGTATTHDYKRVVVTVTATAVSGSPLAPVTYSLETIVSRAGGTTTITPLPTVAFDSQSPPANSYISGSVHVGAVIAAVAPGSTILRLNMYADESVKDLIGAGAIKAQWPPLSWSDTTFMWDTTSVDASGVPLFDDGPHNMTLQVFDSVGGVAFVTRPVYIVNNPPSVPVVTLTGSSATTLTGTWPTCYSNGVPAARYEWQVYDQNNSSGGWQVQESPWNGFVTTNKVVIPKPERFDRYQLRVRSYSPTTPGNPTGLYSDWGYGYGTTRPVLNSVKVSYKYTTSGDKMWTSVVGTPSTDFTPYFPVGGSPTVQYYWNSTMTTSTATAITFPWSNSTIVANSGKPPVPKDFYVVARLTMTPSMNGGGAPSGPITVWSNWVGPATWTSGTDTTGLITLSGW